MNAERARYGDPDLWDLALELWPDMPTDRLAYEWEIPEPWRLVEPNADNSEW